MSTQLSGTVAIVTGASKGIGAGIAKAFAAAGASVIVNYASSKEDADEVVRAITKKDGKAIAVQADMSKLQDIKRLFTEAKKEFGKVDVLVNNAGVYHFEPLEAVTEKELQREFSLNVFGPILAIQEAAKYFGPDGGNIINIGTVATSANPPASVVYTASKGALDSVTRVLAKELGPKKIRVNSINPGGVDTPGTRTAGIVGSDWEKNAITQTPLGRFGSPDDIAPVAVFLASRESGWLTGEILVASGGFR